MSIIYDALKKVDDKDIRVKRQNRFNKKKYIFRFFLLVLIVVLIPFAAANFKKQPSTPTVKKKAVISKNQPIAAKPVQKRTPQPVKEYSVDQYALEGIIYEGDTPLAVINGKLLNKGDIINGFTVKEIMPNSVILLGPDNKETNLTF